MNNVIVLNDYNLLINYDGELTKVASLLFKQGKDQKDIRTLYDAVKNYATITRSLVYLDIEYICSN